MLYEVITVMLALAVTSLVAMGLGVGLYGWSENRARALGGLDRDSAF